MELVFFPLVFMPWIYKSSRPYLRKRRLTLADVMLGIGVFGLIFGLAAQTRWLGVPAILGAAVLAYLYPVVFVARHVPARWEMGIIWTWWFLFWLGCPLIFVTWFDTLIRE
jgi:hypothetical protein